MKENLTKLDFATCHEGKSNANRWQFMRPTLLQENKLKCDSKENMLQPNAECRKNTKRVKAILMAF